MINPGVDRYGNPISMWQSVTTGLLQGVTQIGLNYATQELGLNPLLANIGFSAVSLGIESMINGKGIFEHMSEEYKKNTLTFLGYSPKPDRTDLKYWDPRDMFLEDVYNRDMSTYLWQESIYKA